MTRPVLSAVQVRVLAANIESRKFSPELLALIRKHAPDVVIVEQAYRARRFLLGVNGYRLRQYRRRPGAEWNGIAVLVRQGVTIKRRRALRMKRWWRGPKAGKRHAPRVYPALVLEKSGVTFRVIGVHWPTHNQPAAQVESARAVARYFATHPNSPIIAAGDFNTEAHALEPLARACGAVLLTGGTKVDHALAANVAESSQRRVPTPEGAHGWALYTIEATRENR